MSDIKNVIYNLCKYINLVLEEDFKPEFFRLAKFNRTDDNVVSIYWVILYKLIPKHVMFKNAFSIIDRVKLYFAALQYDSLDFYSLPEDESIGSRELLLALGYLLGEYDALDVLSHSLIANSRVNLEFPSASAEPIVCGDAATFDTEKELINNAMWLIGKINNNFKNIAETDTQTVKLLGKVHKISKNVSGLPHLSANDIYSVKFKEHSYSYMEECKRITNILEAKSKWNKTNSLFWDWMLTVLSEKEKDKSSQNADNSTNLLSFYNVLKDELSATRVKNKPSDGDHADPTDTYSVQSDTHFKRNFHSAAPIQRCIQLNAKQTFQKTKEYNAISPYMNAAQRQVKRTELNADLQKRNAEVQRDVENVEEIIREERRKVDRIVGDIEDQMIGILKQYGCQISSNK